MLGYAVYKFKMGQETWQTLQVWGFKSDFVLWLCKGRGMAE